jgi:murein DD-endopeptidase MepM/ murein hydrolase activator NlpD
MVERDAFPNHAIPSVTAPLVQALGVAPAGPELASRARAFAIREPRAFRALPMSDYGNEPPLEVGTPQAAALTRRALNARWLGASVLTGLAGAALLGSAIYVSSEGEITFAEPAERAPAAGQRSAEEGASAARKGDKLVRSEATASAKQTFRAPVTLRSGEREVIKLRSFVRLATNLSMTSGVYATNIAPFNPLRFFTDSASDRAVDVGPETSDAEVSVMKSDLSMLSVDANAPGISDEDVASQFNEEARLRAEEGRRVAITLPAPLMLSRSAGRGQADSGPATLFPRSIDAPFRSLEVRVVPENVTTLAKTVLRSPELGFSERTVSLARGDALDAVLRTNSASADDSRAIVAALGRDRAVAGEGQQLRILAAPAARPGEARRIVRAMILTERGIEAIAALNDRGTFVSVAPPAESLRSPTGKAPSNSQDDESDDEEGVGVPLYDSLYETAFKHDIPRQTVEDLVRIFGYDVDFQRRVAPGDTLELLCATEEEGSGERLEVLSAALTVGSDTRRVYRYQADDGSVDYFDEAGRSLKKFLLRKPVVEARLSSGFGSRFHPILGYSKMHTGVDWATKTGTPIMAAANGTVIKAAWDSGYGRRTEIQHTNGYVTAYNHQSGFARGVGPGSRVRQGQIIGYVGSTGLSTGAHLHYEVIVNGHFVDPMKIRVPRGRELDGRALTDFRRQREQIDGVMQKAGSSGRLAQGDVR